MLKRAAALAKKARSHPVAPGSSSGCEPTSSTNKGTSHPVTPGSSCGSEPTSSANKGSIHPVTPGSSRGSEATSSTNKGLQQPPRKWRRLNLKESPLMRWAAKRVSLGAEASLFQEVAAASLEEARQTGHSEGVLTASGSPILGACSRVFVCGDIVGHLPLVYSGSRWALTQGGGGKRRDKSEQQAHEALARGRVPKLQV